MLERDRVNPRFTSAFERIRAHYPISINTVDDWLHTSLYDPLTPNQHLEDYLCHINRPRHSLTAIPPPLSNLPPKTTNKRRPLQATHGNSHPPRTRSSLKRKMSSDFVSANPEPSKRITRSSARPLPLQKDDGLRIAKVQRTINTRGPKDGQNVWQRDLSEDSTTQRSRHLGQSRGQRAGNIHELEEQEQDQEDDDGRLEQDMSPSIRKGSLANTDRQVPMANSHDPINNIGGRPARGHFLPSQQSIKSGSTPSKTDSSETRSVSPSKLVRRSEMSQLDPPVYVMSPREWQCEALSESVKHLWRTVIKGGDSAFIPMALKVRSRLYSLESIYC